MYAYSKQLLDWHSSTVSEIRDRAQKTQSLRTYKREEGRKVIFLKIENEKEQKRREERKVAFESPKYTNIQRDILHIYYIKCLKGWKV